MNTITIDGTDYTPTGKPSFYLTVVCVVSSVSIFQKSNYGQLEAQSWTLNPISAFNYQLVLV